MPGKRITDQQYRLYMTSRTLGLTQAISSAKAGFSPRSGRTLESLAILPSQRRQKRWRTRPDPFKEVWESKIVPLLKETPHLSAITLLEYLQEHDPDQYPDPVLRTLQRRLRQWRALHGHDQEIIFRQVHQPGRQGLSDFTSLKGVDITICGQVLRHLLYHFRLAYSGWSWIKVIQGGESFTALSAGLQDALWHLGGCPEDHRTDSLSAAFKNLSKGDREDLTRNYHDLCEHYKMTPSRNNRGQAHENGSIESAHGHLKRRLTQALLIRGSHDFESVSSYQHFIEDVVQRHNRRHKIQIDVERQYLKALPVRRTIDFTETTARVTTSSTLLVQKVVYSVPSRLIGQKVRVHVYHDHLSCYLGRDHVLDLPRLLAQPGKRTRCINYRHLIGGLCRKPQAFRYSVLREDLLPTLLYKQIWQALDQLCTARHACKLMVGILKIAADYECEKDLGERVWTMVRLGHIPCLGSLQKRYQGHSPTLETPKININQHSLQSYNQLIPSFMKEVAYA